MSLQALRGAAGAAHVLVLSDSSAASVNAARRADLVARDLRLPLRTLEADPVAGCVALRDGLLVMPTRDGNPLGEWLMGGPAERLIRLSRAPVLVVKRPAREPYRRVLVPVDLRASSDHLVGVAASLARDAGAAVFHALAPADELLLHEIDAPPGAFRAHRRERAQWARGRMEKLLDNRAARWPPPLVAFGPVADAILAGETGHRADLIVIGKRGRGLLADFLLGSVTRQVLARSEADVLVVPLPHARRGAQRHRREAAALQE